MADNTSMAQISWQQRMITWLHHRPGGWLLVFAVKQAWAALFGGLMLGAIIVTRYIGLPWLPRYDWLFLYALFVQIGMLAFKLERPREVIAIVLFHLVGLVMELFKTSATIQSWQYPGEAFFSVGNVPLFSGFMYAAVGSYIARAWRVLNLEFYDYPRRLFTVLLALAIYCNFFTHHYTYDIRLWLFAAAVVLYGRTEVGYVVYRKRRRMPLPVGFGLIAFFIWVAENIGTYTKGWLYPGQAAQWHIVSPHKFGSWLLLMIISFIMIDLLYAFYNRQAKRHI
jgi:uncharacterized membrane protein YoaT (DUF817 family)